MNQTRLDPLFLAQANRGQLAHALATAPPADPMRIAGFRYLGLSLGLPAWVDRLAWSIFEKDFVHEEEQVRGWNVRLEQQVWSPDIQPTPLLKDGEPFCFGYFGVTTGKAGTLLDYSRGDNPALDPTRLVRDPLVALNPEHTWLLGQSRVQLGPWQVGTPSYFLLHRLAQVSYRP
ncbi:MAG: hypothetical protein ACI9VR_004424 [Cognaticolwellia sp.]|jgi:hypothetical protein